MQVVYSGGSTPTPSPRVQRKQYQGYGRPLMPGYSGGTCSSTPPFHHRNTPKEHKHSSEHNDSSLRDSIPAMSRPVAITCLVLNFLFPGLGTFVAGLSVLCGSHIRTKGYTRQKVIWSNTWVAFLQFVTAFLFLLGWIWSIVWGVTFITLSQEYFKRANQTREKNSPEGQHSKNGFNLGVNRAGSSPGIASSCHLDKPIMLRSSSADQPCQPTIVLQKAPYISRSESALQNPRKETRIRHQKVLTSHTSEENTRLNSTPDKLDQIVVHDLAHMPPPRRGILRRDDTVTSNASDMSEHDMAHL